jgi:hypothetical protein
MSNPTSSRTSTPPARYFPASCGGRAEDALGVAGVVNGISKVHEAFRNSGGLGILIGDGMLLNPGAERIVETYYAFPVAAWRASLDYQAIWNPGYNEDRGPVSVIGVRLHKQFRIDLNRIGCGGCAAGVVSISQLTS